MYPSEGRPLDSGQGVRNEKGKLYSFWSSENARVADGLIDHLCSSQDL